MGIAITLKEYLHNHHSRFEVIEHRRTDSALRTAEAAHVPGDQMVKSVLFGDDESYLLAVIPATHNVRLRDLAEITGRHLSFISETELGQAFADCEIGALPPVGSPYGIETLVDARLFQQQDLYFESGDHCTLLHMSGADFKDLEEESQIGVFSHHL
ncbi:MAG: YbaK/EbsC family protein [Candidatus Thiodiazotropha sp.]|jgi:Ala-tRNA(Pro) deacylase